MQTIITLVVLTKLLVVSSIDQWDRPLSHRIHSRHEYKSCPIIDYYRITPLFMSSQLAMLYLSDWASAMMVMEINIRYTYHVTLDSTNPEYGHGKKINKFTQETWGELERSTSKPYQWEPNFIKSVFSQWLIWGRLSARLSLRAASVVPLARGSWRYQPPSHEHNDTHLNEED